MLSNGKAGWPAATLCEPICRQWKYDATMDKSIRQY